MDLEFCCLILYLPGYFHTLLVPTGDRFAPKTKNWLVSDKSKIFCFLKLFFVKFCGVTKTMMTSAQPVNSLTACKFFLMLLNIICGFDFCYFKDISDEVTANDDVTCMMISHA